MVRDESKIEGYTTMKVTFHGGARVVGGNCVLLEAADGQTQVLNDIGPLFGAFF